MGFLVVGFLVSWLLVSGFLVSEFVVSWFLSFRFVVLGFLGSKVSKFQHFLVSKFRNLKSFQISKTQKPFHVFWKRLMNMP